MNRAAFHVITEERGVTVMVEVAAAVVIVVVVGGSSGGSARRYELREKRECRRGKWRDARIRRQSPTDGGDTPSGIACSIYTQSLIRRFFINRFSSFPDNVIQWDSECDRRIVVRTSFANVLLVSLYRLFLLYVAV